MTLELLWLQLGATAAIILIASQFLARSADVVAEKTGLGRSFVGVVMLATATSLPELGTGISSIVVVDAPDLAAGDAFGSNLFNLMIIGFLDLYWRNGPVLNSVRSTSVVVGALGIGLIALASDYTIEKDFINVIKDKKIDFFVNRIECFNPLTSENLIKMSEKITEVTKDILPNEKIDCVVYGCTSGTIVAGYQSIEKKIKKAKPEAEVTTPSTASIKALKRLNLNKIAIFTPYPKKLNDEVIDFFKKENFQITSNSYFDIASDIDIGKVDANYLYDVLSKMDLKGADALFISCTALPALSIIDKLEKKLGKIVLSSNQALIWDTLEKIGENDSINGFGKLFLSN